MHKSNVQSFHRFLDHSMHLPIVCTIPAPHAVQEESRNWKNDKSDDKSDDKRQASTHFRCSSSSVCAKCAYKSDIWSKKQRNIFCQVLEPSRSCFQNSNPAANEKHVEVNSEPGGARAQWEVDTNGYK